MIHTINTANMTRPEWLAERRNSIGGSELGAILGLNPFCSPYTVWAIKTGLLDEDDDNEAMRQGRDFEDYVAQRFAEKSGLKVRRENAIIRNDAYPYIHANIDRKIIGINAGLECKTANAFAMKKFKGGEFPESYYAQCVTYMAVREFDRYYLAALILGIDFKIYQLTRIKDDICPEWCESSVYVEDEEIKALRQIAIEFWEQNVQTGAPPQMDGTASTAETLNAVYPNSKPGAETDISDVETNIRNYVEIGATIKELQKEQERQKQKIQLSLQDNEIGHSGKYTVTWKNSQRRSFDFDSFRDEYPDIELDDFYKTTTFRTFRVKGE